MAYNFEYPYVDPERYNADWLLNITKETRKMMEQLMQDWETYKTALNAEWAAYQTNLNNQWTAWKAQTLTDIDAWKAQTLTDINAWKAQTLTDLNAWKAQTLTDLNAWKAQTQAGLDAWRATMESEWSQFQGQITGEVTTLKQQFALLQTEMSTFKTDITNQVNSYAQTIAQQNAAIAAMQETVDNFNGQIPGLVQAYLSTLTPSWDLISKRTEIPNLSDIIGAKVQLYGNCPVSQLAEAQARFGLYASEVGVQDLRSSTYISDGTEIAIVVVSLEALSSEPDIIQALGTVSAQLAAITDSRNFASRKIVIMGEHTVMDIALECYLSPYTMEYNQRGSNRYHFTYDMLSPGLVSSALYRTMSNAFVESSDAYTLKVLLSDTGYMTCEIEFAAATSGQNALPLLTNTFDNIPQYLIFGHGATAHQSGSSVSVFTVEVAKDLNGKIYLNGQASSTTECYHYEYRVFPFLKIVDNVVH